MTDPSFGLGSIVMEQIVCTNEYQSTTPLSDTTYYWRVATWNHGGFWDAWPIGVHLHFTKHPGWDSLPNIDHNALNGARLAYCDADRPFDHDAIVAMCGGDDRLFSEYSIGGGYWTPLANTPWNLTVAASLTTTLDTAVGGDEAGYRICSAFGHSEEGDYPCYYHTGDPDGWDVLDDDDPDSTYCTALSCSPCRSRSSACSGRSSLPRPRFRSRPAWASNERVADRLELRRLPDDIDPGSSMALGAYDMMYLTTGSRKEFYGVDVSSFSGGEQARTVPRGRARAQAVTAREGVEVEYQLPVAAHVRATLHDAAGRRMGSPDSGKLKAGTHRLSFNRDDGGRRLSTGAYYPSFDIGIRVG
jgi:hypothetical protein